MTTDDEERRATLGEWRPLQPTEGHPSPVVAASDHMRRLDDGTYVLYVKGSHVPAAHRELEAIPVEQVDGVYRLPTNL